MSDEYVGNFHMVPDKCLFHFMSIVTGSFLKSCIGRFPFLQGNDLETPSYSYGKINSAPSNVRGRLRKQDLPEITWLGRTSTENENRVILVGKVHLTHRMNVISGVMFSPFH